MARTNSLPATASCKNACPPACQKRPRHGSWVAASPAVRRYQTSHEAVRSPRRHGKAAE